MECNCLESKRFSSQDPDDQTPPARSTLEAPSRSIGASTSEVLHPEVRGRLPEVRMPIFTSQGTLQNHYINMGNHI